MTQLLGSLPSTWEMWNEFWTLAQPQLFGHLRTESAGGDTSLGVVLCPCLSL